MKIVKVQSLSYVGTTWINLVLGSHSDVFSLGNPETALRRFRESPDQVCRIHCGNCEFWSEMEIEGEFLTSIYNRTGGNQIVVVNPRSKDIHVELDQPGVEVAQVQIVRDCRALTASWRRKNSNCPILVVLQKWLFGASSVYPYRGNDPEWISIHYEKAVGQPGYLFEKCEKATGLEYKKDALQYWLHNHHLATGNGSTVETVAEFQGRKGAAGIHLDTIYQEFVDKAKLDRGPTFQDNRWENELTEYDRFLVDLFCGEENAKRGYERDHFSPSITSSYISRLKKELKESDFDDCRFDFVDNL